jgi:hypothetical protein
MEGMIYAGRKTNPSDKDKESDRDKDEAVVSPSAPPPLVVEHLDTPRKEGTVQA